MELVYDVLYLRAYIFHTFPSAPYVHVLFPITHLLLTSSSLPRDDDMLQESGIYTGQVMILEVKKDDGTWPRETYVSQSSMVSCVFSVYASLNSSTEHCCMVNIALLCTVCFSCCFLLASQNHTSSNEGGKQCEETFPSVQAQLDELRPLVNARLQEGTTW